jgi:hypothetical protein
MLKVIVMNIGLATFDVFDISLLIQSNLYSEYYHVVSLPSNHRSSICVVMNRRIFVNEATNMIDGMFIQLSTFFMKYLWDNHSSVFSFFFSGMDITYGCMPNKFSHILFGQLKSLSDNANHLYRGDRIYIKPERYGLQQFQHYLWRKYINFALFRPSMFLAFRCESLYSSSITFLCMPIR